LSRLETTVVGEIDADTGRGPAEPAYYELDPPSHGIVVDRLIGSELSRLWVLTGIWLTVAFTAAFGLYVNYRAQGLDVTFGSVLMAMIPHYSFWVLVSPPIYRSLHKSIEAGDRPFWLSMLMGWSAIALAGSTAMSYFSFIIRHDLSPTFRNLIEIYLLPPAGPAFWAMNFSTLAVALVAFAAIRNLRLRDQALWNSAQTELRRARLEAQLAEARLQALQAQINPHFLLNSLNAIASLVQLDERERAFDSIGRLGDLLRIALRNGRDLNVTFGDELDFLDSYLKLCKLRFESNFQYSISVPEALRNRRVPALIVQPLIENAIRHGMDPPRVLNVDIRAYVQNAAIVIEVEDDGRGITAERAAALPAGHGLANVFERLRLCFGAAGDLRLEPREPCGTRARIVIGG
jgi:signal transduction histidine kinase